METKTMRQRKGMEQVDEVDGYKEEYEVDKGVAGDRSGREYRKRRKQEMRGMY